MIHNLYTINSDEVSLQYCWYLYFVLQCAASYNICPCQKCHITACLSLVSHRFTLKRKVENAWKIQCCSDGTSLEEGAWLEWIKLRLEIWNLQVAMPLTMCTWTPRCIISRNSLSTYWTSVNLNKVDNREVMSQIHEKSCVGLEACSKKDNDV